MFGRRAEAAGDAVSTYAPKVQQLSCPVTHEGRAAACRVHEAHASYVAAAKVLDVTGPTLREAVSVGGRLRRETQDKILANAAAFLAGKAERS